MKNTLDYVIMCKAGFVLGGWSGGQRLFAKCVIFFCIFLKFGLMLCDRRWV